jgi:ribonuclease P protein component
MELSTGMAPKLAESVDNFPPELWFGCVVPKRHAKRSVTRNLLKRQVRGAFQRHAVRLCGGLWLVRLRAPFASAEFVSARSCALAAAARGELDGLLGGAAG